MSSLMDTTRQLYQELMNPDDSMREKPCGAIAKHSLDDRRLDFLREYMQFVMKTKVVSATTKTYIRSGACSMRSAFERYNAGVAEPERVNIKTGLSKVHYDKTKLATLFKDDMLTRIMYHQAADLDAYEKDLFSAMRKYAAPIKPIKGYMLPLRPVPPADISCLDHEIEDFMDMIYPYTAAGIKQAREAMTDEWNAFLRFIIDAPNDELSSFRKGVKRRILEMLAAK